METIKLKKELEKLFPEYEFKTSEDTDSVFGVLSQESKTFRDSSKNLIITKDRYIFVSGVMYKDNPDMVSFRYATINTSSEIRNYRCKSFHSHEYNKKFTSANEDEELLEKIKAEFK